MIVGDDPPEGGHNKDTHVVMRTSDVPPRKYNLKRCDQVPIVGDRNETVVAALAEVLRLPNYCRTSPLKLSGNTGEWQGKTVVAIERRPGTWHHLTDGFKAEIRASWSDAFLEQYGQWATYGVMVALEDRGAANVLIEKDARRVLFIDFETSFRTQPEQELRVNFEFASTHGGLDWSAWKADLGYAKAAPLVRGIDIMDRKLRARRPDLRSMMANNGIPGDAISRACEWIDLTTPEKVAKLRAII